MSKKTEVSLFAITSLNLAILSIIFIGAGVGKIAIILVPITGIAAIILGFIALSQIKRFGFSGKIIAISGIFIGVIGTFVIPLILSWGVLWGDSSKNPAPRIACLANMKQIGLALKQYAMDYDGEFPPYNGAKGLELLRKNIDFSENKIYICPCTTTKPAKTGEPLSEATVDYVYIGGLTIKDPPDTIILYDKNNNHKKYRNTLYIDIHVEATLIK